MSIQINIPSITEIPNRLVLQQLARLHGNLQADHIIMYGRISDLHDQTTIVIKSLSVPSGQCRHGLCCWWAARWHAHDTEARFTSLLYLWRLANSLCQVFFQGNQHGVMRSSWHLVPHGVFCWWAFRWPGHGFSLGRCFLSAMVSKVVPPAVCLFRLVSS